MNLDTKLRDTAPDRLPPLDHGHLQTRGRRRRHRGRALVATGTVAAVALLTATITTVARPTAPDMVSGPGVGLLQAADGPTTVPEGLAFLEDLVAANPGFPAGDDLVVDTVSASGGMDFVPGAAPAWGEVFLTRNNYDVDPWTTGFAIIRDDLPNSDTADQVAERIATLLRDRDGTGPEALADQMVGDIGSGDMDDRPLRALALAAEHALAGQVGASVTRLLPALGGATSGDDLLGAIEVLRTLDAVGALTWGGRSHDPLLGNVVALVVTQPADLGPSQTTTLHFDATTGRYEGARQAVVLDGEQLVFGLSAVLRRGSSNGTDLLTVPDAPTIALSNDAGGDGGGDTMTSSNELDLDRLSAATAIRDLRTALARTPTEGTGMQTHLIVRSAVVPAGLAPSEWVSIVRQYRALQPDDGSSGNHLRAELPEGTTTEQVRALLPTILPLDVGPGDRDGYVIDEPQPGQQDGPARPVVDRDLLERAARLASQGDQVGSLQALVDITATMTRDDVGRSDELLQLLSDTAVQPGTTTDLLDRSVVTLTAELPGFDIVTFQFDPTTGLLTGTELTVEAGTTSDGSQRTTTMATLIRP